MNPSALRAFPSFPPRREDLHWSKAETQPFPFHRRSGISTYRFARSAVYAGLKAIGVQPGDEVLMPEFHHGCEVETVRALGASIRFYPIEPDLTVRPEKLEPLLSNRTRCLYVIHYFGFPQPLSALRRFCEERKLLLFEDCALALLSADGHLPLGSVGEAAAFCLYKTLPVPDGGLLVLNGREAQQTESGTRFEYAKAARDALVWMRSLTRARAPMTLRTDAAETRPRAPIVEERTRAGHPFFDPAQLEFAISPLTRPLISSFDLAEVKRRRRRNYTFWTEAVADHLECVRPLVGDGVCPLLFPILVEDKEGLRAALRKDGIEIHNWWHRWYGGAPEGECAENDRLRRHLVGLPVQQNLNMRDLERIRVALARHLPRQV